MTNEVRDRFNRSYTFDLETRNTRLRIVSEVGNSDIMALRDGDSIIASQEQLIHFQEFPKPERNSSSQALLAKVSGAMVELNHVEYGAK